MVIRSRDRLRPFAFAVFGALYLGIQGLLIATAGVRPDHAYGFWMFHESSSVELLLYRWVEDPSDPSKLRRVEVVGGKGLAAGSEWQARTTVGAIETRTWRERVKQPELGTFRRRIPAAYGSSAVLARLTRALEDVSAHADDLDTCRFEIDARVFHNGRDRGTTRLQGPWRCHGKAPP